MTKRNQQPTPLDWKGRSDRRKSSKSGCFESTDVLGAAGVPYAVVGGNAVVEWVSRIYESAVRNTGSLESLFRLAGSAARETDIPVRTQAPPLN